MSSDRFVTLVTFLFVGLRAQTHGASNSSCTEELAPGSGSDNVYNSRCIPITDEKLRLINTDCIPFLLGTGNCYIYDYRDDYDTLEVSISILQAGFLDMNPSPYCNQLLTAYVCHYAYPGCDPANGAPPALCESDCVAYSEEGICDDLFDLLTELSQVTDVLPFEARCNDTLWYLRDEFGQEIDYNATECTSISSVVTLPEPEPAESVTPDPETTATDLPTSVIVSITVVVPISILISIVVIVLVCYGWMKRQRNTKMQMEVANREPSSNGPLDQNQYEELKFKGLEMLKKTQSTLSSETVELLNVMPDWMVFRSDQIHVLKSIGEGEFGIVYKARVNLLTENGMETRIVAIKTLKGFFSPSDVQDIVQEIQKMHVFDHPNVMSLIGVSLNGCAAPSILMPFMANGSLLHHLRREKEQLCVKKEDADRVEIVLTQLMRICLQISKGMEYLALMRFVHRDLAARNCMIDGEGIIKIADFGLAEDMYNKNYFRHDKNDPKAGQAKIPFKWLPLESLQEGVFNEKTDVWSFGVTCWEVFTAGKIPFPAVGPTDLVKLLQDGGRLDKPLNLACSDDMYTLMLKCWNAEPVQRPYFSEIVVEISSMLEVSAGYLSLQY